MNQPHRHRSQPMPPRGHDGPRPSKTNELIAQLDRFWTERLDAFKRRLEADAPAAELRHPRGGMEDLNR